MCFTQLSPKWPCVSQKPQCPTSASRNQCGGPQALGGKCFSDPSPHFKKLQEEKLQPYCGTECLPASPELVQGRRLSTAAAGMRTGGSPDTVQDSGSSLCPQLRGDCTRPRPRQALQETSADSAMLASWKQKAIVPTAALSIPGTQPLTSAAQLPGFIPSPSPANHPSPPQNMPRLGERSPKGLLQGGVGTSAILSLGFTQQIPFPNISAAKIR